MYIDTARNARHIGKKITTTGSENYHMAVYSLCGEKWRQLNDKKRSPSSSSRSFRSSH